MARQGNFSTPHYEIRIGARLDASWAAWFDGMQISLESLEGQLFITVLAGPVADQAALFGLLCRIRDLGLPLISVNRIKVGIKE